MKKCIQLSAFVLTLALLLCACSPKNGQINSGTTEATVTPTVTPTTAPTTESAADLTTTPTAPTVQLSEEERFQKLIKEEYWYWHALGCTFEKPEDISLEYYMYGGIHPLERVNANTYTDEEKAYLDSKLGSKYGENAWASASKMPVAKINEALSVLGVTIEDVKIPERWVYYDKTDSYYVWVRDAYGIVGWNVTDVVTENGGLTKVYWEIKNMHLNTATGEYWNNGVKMVMTMQAKPDGGYLILSNVVQQ